MASEAKYRAKHGKELKILSTKEIPIALAQLAASNTSENVLMKSKNYIFFVSSKKKY